MYILHCPSVSGVHRDINTINLRLLLFTHACMTKTVKSLKCFGKVPEVGEQHACIILHSSVVEPTP